MNILYIPSGLIIAAGDYKDEGATLDFKDQIVPKIVVPGYQIVDVKVPDGFVYQDYTYVNGALVPNAPPPPQVPQKIVGWKWRTVMKIHALTDTIQVFIDAIADKDMRIACENSFNSADVFTRDDKLLNYIMDGIKQSSADVDAYFIEADAIEG